MNLEADQAVQEARFAGACQDQHTGRPAPISKRNQSRLRGLGFGFSPGPANVILKKSPGGKQAKRWETAETAAAEVGGLEGSGHGIPPLPPPPGPRVSRL